jgi:glutamate racemase
MVEASQAIGVFDSGVGGLTVLQALRKQLPAERLIYVGDTANLPYGNKRPSTIVGYALDVAELLVRCGVKLIVVACNTASAHALPALRKRYPGLLVLGVIEATVLAACAATDGDRLMVMATSATVQARAYDSEILRRRPAASILSVAAPLLVNLAEEGWIEGGAATEVIRRYLAPALQSQAQPDALILGCTHFPLFTEAIRAIVGPQTLVIDGSAATASLTARTLSAHRLRAAGGAVEPSLSILATEAPDQFELAAHRILQRPVVALDAHEAVRDLGRSAPRGLRASSLEARSA